MRGLYSSIIEDFLKSSDRVVKVTILEAGHRSKRAIYQGLKDQIVVKGITTIDVYSRGTDIYLAKTGGTVRA